jgi:hypothetical protein
VRIRSNCIIHLIIIESAVEIEKIFKHPDFSGNAREFNIAVVLVRGGFKEGGSIKVRSLGFLEATKSYQLFGWGQITDDQRSEPVTVQDSQTCDPNFPQVFCSTFGSVTARTCDAQMGSPLIAVDSSFAGFVINNSGRCEIVGDKFVLNYVSIGEHKDWIEVVSGAEKSLKVSLLVISFASVAVKVFM